MRARGPELANAFLCMFGDIIPPDIQLLDIFFSEALAYCSRFEQEPKLAVSLHAPQHFVRRGVGTFDGGREEQPRYQRGTSKGRSSPCGQSFNSPSQLYLKLDVLSEFSLR